MIRSHDEAVSIGAGSAVLENCTVIGRPGMGVAIGRRTVFGHRCTIVGATIGDLCEIGNGSTILGEGTLVPAGARLPDASVWVGRPARKLRDATDADVDRLRGLRDGDLSIPDEPTLAYHPEERDAVGTLYAYKDHTPEIGQRTVLFDSAEVTGDVRIGRD